MTEILVKQRALSRVLEAGPSSGVDPATSAVDRDARRPAGKRWPPSLNAGNEAIAFLLSSRARLTRSLFATTPHYSDRLLGCSFYILLSLLLSCADSTPNRGPAPGDEAEVVRTADPLRRGLKEDDFPRIQELAEGVYSYEQLRSSGEELFTTVSLIVTSAEGVLVADGQGSLEETQRLVDEIAKLSDQPITHVVICSDHGDHTAGNQAFPQNAQFLAHPTSHAILQGQADRQAAADRPVTVVMPTQLVEQEQTIRLGGRAIQLLYLGRAHTGGDLSVYLPEEKILFMSEAFLNRIFPAMRSAYPSEWVEMIRRAQSMDVETYVPGHGFVESSEILSEELDTFRQAVEAVIVEARRLHELGLTAEQAAERAQFGALEQWSLRSSQAARAIERVFQELNGELP